MAKETEEKSLEEKLRELEAELEIARTENNALRKIVKKQEETILEYQYEKGEKTRPLDEVSLGDYLKNLLDKSKRPKYEGKGYIIEAEIKDAGFRRDWWFFGLNFLCIDILDQEGNTVKSALNKDGKTITFSKYSYNSKKRKETYETLKGLIGKKTKLIAYSFVGPFDGLYLGVRKIISEGKMINL